MQIKRKSLVSGIERTKELDIDPEKLAMWEKGDLLIQEAFPNLSADDREFIMTGITSDEWGDVFGEDDE